MKREINKFVEPPGKFLEIVFGNDNLLGFWKSLCTGEDKIKYQM